MYCNLSSLDRINNENIGLPQQLSVKPEFCNKISRKIQLKIRKVGERSHHQLKGQKGKRIYKDMLHTIGVPFQVISDRGKLNFKLQKRQIFPYRWRPIEKTSSCVHSHKYQCSSRYDTIRPSIWAKKHLWSTEDCIWTRPSYC